MQSETSVSNILTNSAVWECKNVTSSIFWQNHVTGDRWSQHPSLKLHTWPVEISTGRGRKFWKYLQPQLWDGEWYAQTLLVGESRCHELSFPMRASPRNDLGWVPRVVAQPRKSRFTGGYNVPDVRLLAPPDAMKCAPSDPRFHDAYFDTLSYGV